MYRLLLSLFLAALAAPGMAQECAGGRYADPVFMTYDSTMAVVFGSNTAVVGGQQTLRMDVYQPTGDTLSARPVVLVAFGGSFVSGSRQDVAMFCRELARRGYVAIAPDYRIGFFFPNPLSTMQAVMRGTHDLKGCVRYLRRSVAEMDNPWRIDTTRIIVGGVSAGAISALHATYLNEESEMPVQLIPVSDQIGGIEGNSGSPGWSSEVAACFSFSGVLGDTLWIQAGDPPLASVHEELDPIVPYYTQEILAFSQPTGLIGSGSHDIHLRLENLDIANCFRGYPGNGHLGYLLYDTFGSTQYVYDFCAKVVCGLDPHCGMSVVDVAEQSLDHGLTLHPNPTSDAVFVQAPFTGAVTVLDLNGRVVLQDRITGTGARLSLAHLPDGVYLLRAAAMPHVVYRIVKTR
jgi:para-nitrobenzyl esterase